MTEPAAPTILIAEDEAPIRTFLTVLLSGAGYEPLVAEDGQAAWEMIEQRDGRIDLLLSNIVMPRMTGVELAERVSNAYPHIKILLVSAYDQGLLVLSRGWAFLPKPYLATTLLTKIQEVLASSENPPF
jgi:two-component system cell cycle sensor histidine kinase/response regulator CckA